MRVRTPACGKGSDAAARAADWRGSADSVPATPADLEPFGGAVAPSPPEGPASMPRRAGTASPLATAASASRLSEVSAAYKPAHTGPQNLQRSGHCQFFLLSIKLRHRRHWPARPLALSLGAK